MSYMQHYEDNAGGEAATIRRAPRPPPPTQSVITTTSRVEPSRYDQETHSGGIRGGHQDTAASNSKVQRVHVNQIFLRHPRSILILACVQLCLGIQLIIFGMICRFYDGCRYATGIWCGVLFSVNAVIGILLVKAYPKIKFLYLYLVTTLICCVLSLTIFIILACHLDSEEKFLARSWDEEKQRYKDGVNRIIESTKIAMYALQLVLAASHGICVVISAVLCYLNIWCGVSEGEVHKAYYVTQSPYGHQTMLYPVEVTNSKPPEAMPLLLVDKINTATQTVHHSQV